MVTNQPQKVDESQDIGALSLADFRRTRMTAQVFRCKLGCLQFEEFVQLSVF